VARKEKDEQTRLLRLISKEDAQLEWPCQNHVMIDMEERGLVKITQRFKSRWGGAEHDCARLTITDAGWNALIAADRK
jgi:hypothetical protein